MVWVAGWSSTGDLGSTPPLWGVISVVASEEISLEFTGKEVSPYVETSVAGLEGARP
jgi:hypothetical protein